ncbi:hypothetical protein [Rhodococcus tukisamuensis]|uniref:Uncharacterized protein n=1 Tax=Rhodococcus tukisamuensis TaxID=168276 RepID=A0A1G7ED36_9NOCA|nr:hypothetical protein [Rhodococcus tukisamuensis]SDE61598.1 hypothetical protein SAMN05444580_12352 [Rhodococcus tukisamuensis]
MSLLAYRTNHLPPADLQNTSSRHDRETNDQDNPRMPLALMVLCVVSGIAAAATVATGILGFAGNASGWSVVACIVVLTVSLAGLIVDGIRLPAQV